MKECDGKTPKYLRTFWPYHDANPEVYERYLQKAKQWEAQGRTRFSISEVTEFLRNRTGLVTVDPQGLKLRNVNRAYYARLLILARPSLGLPLVVKPLGESRRQSAKPVQYNAGWGLMKGRSLATLWMTGLWPEEIVALRKRSG